MFESDKTFLNGARFVRADFHLHTWADRRHFKYTGDENYYISSYVEALGKAGIRVGVITNHNLFDRKEFHDLSVNAAKHGILLLPGIELSVNDGANGVHLLVVFSEEWIANGRDFINEALTTLFIGQPKDVVAGGSLRTQGDLLFVQDTLDKFNKDYFLVFAHVEDRCGLWEEWDGGRMREFANDKYAPLRKRVLGFQKVRTGDRRVKIKAHLGAWYPSEVEGSDAKCISEIGRGNAGYVKIGAFTFKAVKFALQSCGLRTHMSTPQPHARINQISYVGGILDGVTVDLSAGLTTLIGIRGSGKSAILETLRYALEIPDCSDVDVDRGYKQKLIGFALKGGGKIVVDATSRLGQNYRIERIYGESKSSVYLDGVLQPGLSIGETVIAHPLYFGQKELSGQSIGSERDLLEKLSGGRFDDERRRVESCENAVRMAVAQLKDASDNATQLEELRTRKRDIEHQLSVFKKANVEDRLERQTQFDADLMSVDNFVQNVRGLSGQLSGALDDAGFVDDKSLRDLASLPDQEEEYNRLRDNVRLHLDAVKENVGHLMSDVQELDRFRSVLSHVRETRAEEFASILRDVIREMGDKFADLHVNPEDFVRLRGRLAQTNQFIEMLDKRSEQGALRKNALSCAVDALKSAWFDDFQSKKAFYDQMSGGDISIGVAYRGDRAAFVEKLKEVVRGLKVRDATIRGIAEHYQDFIDIYADLANARSLFGSNPDAVEQAICGRLDELLVYRVPDKIEITYHGKPLSEHSIGQRASVLMMFILAQAEHDLIMIDQPEDDLDNQTIYQDVIKELQVRKAATQFVFATHNPNIPVLGDAEQVCVCSMSTGKECIRQGSLDSEDIQSDIIRVMEGGKEAFARRREIYGQWN